MASDIQRASSDQAILGPNTNLTATSQQAQTAAEGQQSQSYPLGGAKSPSIVFKWPQDLPRNSTAEGCTGLGLQTLVVSHRVCPGEVYGHASCCKNSNGKRLTQALPCHLLMWEGMTRGVERWGRGHVCCLPHTSASPEHIKQTHKVPRPSPGTFSVWSQQL